MNEQENRRLVITSATKHEINEVVSRNTQKSMTQGAKSCFANLNLLPFCHSC